ncbi:MAG: TIGR03087 family PEP-CTERM/XrtA system glycosyltransferase [Janthinobacterium lividum]
MQDLLFVSHCTPYPPDKGEKIRAFNVIKHLSQHYRIHLGCLTDQAADAGHLESLRQWCKTVAGFPINRPRQKVKALALFRPGRPLMLDYYRQAGLQRWVMDRLEAPGIDLAYVYTVAMMPYVEHARRLPLVLDATDIDSEKWSTYAETAGFPMRLLWSREGKTLLEFERRSAARADATLFVSPHEAGRFKELAPEQAERIFAVENGVDLSRFSPDTPYDTPFASAGPNVVFTGHMDYWPNADAVAWFAEQVVPGLRAASPGLTFSIVGANPGPATRKLADTPGIVVTGRVADVRPYLAHADVCVAPLRIARGIQNKVLEAMAMGRPMVASPQAFAGIRATSGRDLLVADGTAATQQAILDVLHQVHPGLGASGRRAVEQAYAWSATLAGLDTLLENVAPSAVVG